MRGDLHEFEGVAGGERPCLPEVDADAPGMADSTRHFCPRKVASGMEWVTKMMVVPVSRQIRRSSSLSLSRAISSSAPKGSSMSSTRGRQTRARAIDTRCRIPPESSWGSAASRPARPTRASSSSGSACCSTLPPRPPTSSGRRTLSMALRQGSRVASWNTKEKSRASRASSGVRPNTLISPSLTGTRSATARRRVDFPHPEGPSMVTRPPAGTSKLTPSSAVTGPASLSNRTARSRTDTAAGPAAGLSLLPAPGDAADPAAVGLTSPGGPAAPDHSGPGRRPPALTRSASAGPRSPRERPSSSRRRPSASPP